MSGMMGYCGLICHTCPIYLATREESREGRQKKRTEIARLCREQSGLQYEPEDITDCDGCRSESGRLFSGCGNCRIRSCARQRELENCACCGEYACAKLEAFFIMEPAAKARLDEIRRSRP